MSTDRADSIGGHGGKRSKARFFVPLIVIIILGFFAIRFVVNRSAGNKDIIPPDAAEEALSGLDVELPKPGVSK